MDSIIEIVKTYNEEGETCITQDIYLENILHELRCLQKNVLSKSDTFMSVAEHRHVKEAVDIIISIGIIPCLLPAIGTGVNQLRQRPVHLPDESISDLEKYNRLAHTTKVLIDCYSEISLRPIILTQLEPLVGALFQLSYAPLMKPTLEKIQHQFHMTQELYDKLLEDHEEFSEVLDNFIKNCPQSEVMRALMFLFGLRNAPKWLSRRVRSHLVAALVEPTGVMSLINTTCEDTLDLGLHWNRLDTISKLIAIPHNDDSEAYYNAVCPQVINILKSKNSRNATTVANTCINAIYEANPEICRTKIINVIAAPFMVKYSPTSGVNTVLMSEAQVSECMESLVKCFVANDAKFKCLPCALMKEIAVPLFAIHSKVYKSALFLRTKIRKLLINLLSNFDLRNHLFSKFLENDLDSSQDFGEKLCFQFGPSGGLEIINRLEQSDSDEYSSNLADSLFDLVKDDEALSLSLLNYLLRWLTQSNEKKSRKSNERLETEDDHINSLFKQLTVEKLMMNLTSINTVQKGLINSPESLLAFIRSLFGEELSNENSEHFETLYTSLMAVKIILTEGGKPINWTPFQEFTSFLKERINILEDPSPMLNLIRDLLEIIKIKGRSRRYHDFSTDSKTHGKCEKALEDLANPLLPIRAHGLISLTKLIEISDPHTIAKKDLILCLFQENLKDDDSFVYLAAVNGLCALALSFPDQVIEILVQEFIGMPQRNLQGEIYPENRVKLGEILVKTTRALGEMAPKYKNMLINGFLCAVRDSDTMVRASSLSCLGELCKVLGFRLGNAITEILLCLGCIIQTDKAQECRRAAVLVITLLIQGLGEDVLVNLESDILLIYRHLKHLRDNDSDHILRLHAQTALEEIDDIVQKFLFVKPVLQKNINIII